MKVSFLAPPSPFAFSATYAVTVEGNDKLGNALASTSFSFTVLPQPAVSSTIPANNASGVLATSPITLEFNQPMERASVEAAFSTSPTITYAWAWSADSKTTSCLPTAPFGYSMSYAAVLEASASSAAGDTLAAPYGFAFTTAAEPDTTRPTIISVSPLADSGNSRRNVSIALSFSEQMDRVSTEAAFAVTSPAGKTGGTFSWNTAGDVMSYKPPTEFVYGDTVTWTLSATAKDMSGNGLAAPASGSFRVVKQQVVPLYGVTGPGKSGSVSSNGDVKTSPLLVGDIASRAYWRTFISFDLSQLPTPLVALSNAELYVRFSTNILPTSLGTLWASGVDYGEELSFADFDGPVDVFPRPCGHLRICEEPYSYSLLPQSSGIARASVTGKIFWDLGDPARGNRVQFRLNFQTNSDNDATDDNVSLTSMTDQRLDVTDEYAW